VGGCGPDLFGSEYGLGVSPLEPKDTPNKPANYKQFIDCFKNFPSSPKAFPYGVIIKCIVHYNKGFNISINHIVGNGPIFLAIDKK